MSDAEARAQEARDLEKALISTEVGRMWPDASYARRAYALLPVIADTVDALVADLDRVTLERDSQDKVLAACARLLGDEMPAWEPLPVRELGCASCAELAAVLEREQQLRDLAKSAKSVAAAPDYDEEAIRDALWALVDAVLAEGRPE